MKKELEIAFEKCQKWKNENQSLKKQRLKESKFYEKEILSLRSELHLLKSAKNQLKKQFEVK